MVNRLFVQSILPIILMKIAEKNRNKINVEVSAEEVSLFYKISLNLMKKKKRR